MRPQFALAACLTCLWPHMTLAQAPLSAAQRLDADALREFVDGVAQQAMAAGHIAGAAVSVVQDGSVVLMKGYGFADVASGRRVDPETTLFRIGSITKTFTWIAVMNAIEGGRLALDDPINQRLPEALHVPEQGFSEPIRVRHLLTHSPGFEDRMFGHLFETDAGEVRPLPRYLREERPMRVRAPGSVSSYSNYGVALIGAALEHIHGRSWQEIIEEQILVPVGMSHTSVREPHGARDGLPAPMPEGLRRQLSTGYRWNGTGHDAQRFEFITHQAPAGAMSSTAGDMARYMLMLLADGVLDGSGNRIFGARAARAFRTPMTSLPQAAGNWNAGFIDVPLTRRYRMVGHDGGSLLFFSSMVLVPDLRLGIFVTTNTAGGDRLSGPFAARIVEHFYDEAAPPAAPKPGLAASTWEGYYLQTRRPYSGLQGFFYRMLARRVRVSSDGYIIAALLGPPQRFVPGDSPNELRAVEPEAGIPGLRAVGEEGRIVRLEMPLMAFERVSPLMAPPVPVGLGALTMLLSLITVVRHRSGPRGSATQRRLSRLQLGVSLAWLTAVVALGLFAASVIDDETSLLVGWPSASILIFSTAALVASVMSLLMLVPLPAVWRHVEGGWTRPRVLRHVMTTLVFAMLGAILAIWGALQPWNP